MKKLSLINGENLEAGNAQQAERRLQRLNERAPKEILVEATVRTAAIT